MGALMPTECGRHGIEEILHSCSEITSKSCAMRQLLRECVLKRCIIPVSGGKQREALVHFVADISPAPARERIFL